jgi:hypothetical protein
MLSKDGWGGLVVLATSLSLFWLTLGLKESPLVPIGPGFYPRIVLALGAALGLWILLADVFRRRKSRAQSAAKAAGRLDYPAVAIQFGVFALYVAALAPLGFRIATFFYVAAANALMAPPRGSRGWLRVAVLAFGAVVVTYVVFERYLLVLLPRGRWTGF